jgi:hypothetical protein
VKAFRKKSYFLTRPFNQLPETKKIILCQT